MPDSTDFRPSATLETLKKRSELLEGIRSFFRERNFLEVETPILSRDVIVDAYLEPFSTHWVPEGSPPTGNHESKELFLQTSPEFAMKRLLAAGARAIYQITRAFRNGEIGRYHNPEFTMLEWYHVGWTHHDQMQFTEELVKAVFRRAATFDSGDDKQSRDESQPFQRISYDEAFEKHTGTKVLQLNPRELDELARSKGIAVPQSLNANDRDGRLNLLLAELVEPHLGNERPVFLYDYPASQAALAKIRPDDLPVAERFELYIRGMEICNGYHELTDAEELRSRIRTQSALRAADGRRRLPERSRLLEAMQVGLPDCSGVALGVDRLVMQALGADSIAQVTAFPFDQA